MALLWLLFAGMLSLAGQIDRPSLLSTSLLSQAHAQSNDEKPIVQARITVEREHTAEASFIVVKIKLPIATSASAFVVSAPPRIVVDLEGTRIRKSSSLAVPANKVLKQIRIGAHPEKLRIVLDVFSDPAPSFEQVTEGNTVTVKILESVKTDGEHATSGSESPTLEQGRSPSFSREEPPLQQPSELPEATGGPQESPATTDPFEQPGAVVEKPVAPTARSATATPTTAPSPTNTNTPAPTATFTPSPTPTPSPTFTPTVTPSATSTPDPRSLGIPAAEGKGGLVGDVSIAEGGKLANQLGRLLVLAYRFDYLQPGKIPILKITLSRTKVEVQRSKIDSKTYKIVIPQAGVVSAQLTLPQFPPADFAGFTMVTAQEFDNRTEITISVDPGVTLGTFVRDQEIWVKRM